MGDVMVRGQTIVVEQKLVTETCCECGLLFAMTEDFKNEKLKYRESHNRRSFYCPNGHQQHYLGETEETKLRRERDRLKNDADWQRRRREEAEARAKHQEHRANGYKGHATRVTKRAKAGVCPCCNRTFQQLARHMATKHPTFAPIELEEGATVQ